MWVVVFLTACADGSGTTIDWSFADHRTCAEADVVTVVVRDAERELVRAPCDPASTAVDAVTEGEALRVEAIAYHGTVMYRGHAVAGGARTHVTLRYVGGRSP